MIRPEHEKELHLIVERYDNFELSDYDAVELAYMKSRRYAFEEILEELKKGNCDTKTLTVLLENKISEASEW